MAYTGRPSLPLYVLVEKILGTDEPLPDDWPVAGTTGYDFLNLLNGLFTKPQGLAEIRGPGGLPATRSSTQEVVHRCKLLILRVAMSSELQMLAHRLNRISEQHFGGRAISL